MRRAYLFTNHSPSKLFSGYENIRLQDAVVAVDKGLETVFRQNRTANAIIGDLDSLDPQILQHFQKVPLIRHQTEKNETDTELALLWCMQQDFSELIICNDLLGRVDHALALIQNLLLLKRRYPKVQAGIESENQRLFFLDPETNLEGRPGQLLSLISCTENAVFTGSQGLKYPLANLTLHNHLSRGISNEFCAQKVSIAKLSGDVLAILSHKD